MKALTLIQPWAQAIALGNKHYETRSWSTHYRGLLAIHAGKGMPAYAMDFARMERSLGRIPARLANGAFVAIVRLVDVLPAEQVALDLGIDGGLERLYGDYSPGRWAWQLELVRALDEPIGCTGHQGLWNVPAEIEPLLVAEPTEEAT